MGGVPGAGVCEAVGARCASPRKRCAWAQENAWGPLPHHSRITRCGPGHPREPAARADTPQLHAAPCPAAARVSPRESKVCGARGGRAGPRGTRTRVCAHRRACDCHGCTPTDLPHRIGEMTAGSGAGTPGVLHPPTPSRPCSGALGAGAAAGATAPPDRAPHSPAPPQKSPEKAEKAGRAAGERGRAGGPVPPPPPSFAFLARFFPFILFPFLLLLFLSFSLPVLFFLPSLFSFFSLLFLARPLRRFPFTLSVSFPFLSILGIIAFYFFPPFVFPFPPFFLLFFFPVFFLAFCLFI